MIVDWFSSLDRAVVLFYTFAWGTLALAMPETMETVQLVISALPTDHDHSTFDSITRIIKTMVTILAGLSLIAWQSGMAFEAWLNAIEKFRQYRQKKKRDVRREKGNQD